MSGLWGAVAERLVDGASSLAALAEQAIERESDDEYGDSGTGDYEDGDGDDGEGDAAVWKRGKGAHAVEETEGTHGNGHSHAVRGDGTRAGGLDSESRARGRRGGDPDGDGAVAPLSAQLADSRRSEASLRRRLKSLEEAYALLEASKAPEPEPLAPLALGAAAAGAGELEDGDDAGASAGSPASHPLRARTASEGSDAMDDVYLGSPHLSARAGAADRAHDRAGIASSATDAGVELNEVRQRCAALTLQASDLREQLADVQAQLSASQAAHRGAEERLAQQVARNEGLERTLADAQAVAEEARLEVERQRAAASEPVASISGTSDAAVEALRSQVGELTAALHAAKEAERLWAGELETARGARSGAEAELTELRADKARLQAQITAAATRPAAAPAATAASPATNGDESGALASAIADREAAEALADALEKDVDTLTAQVEALQAAAAAGASRGSGGAPVVGDGGVHTRELEAAVDAAKCEAEAAKSDATAQREAAVAAETRATELEMSASVLRANSADAMAELQRSREANDALTTQVASLTEQLKAANEAAGAAQRSAAAAAAQERVPASSPSAAPPPSSSDAPGDDDDKDAAALRAELDTVRKALAEQATQRDGVVEAYHRLQQSFQNLQSEYRDAHAREAGLREAADSTARDLEAAHELIATLKRAMASDADRIKEIETLRAERDDHASAYASLRRDVDSREMGATSRIRKAENALEDADATVEALRNELQGVQERADDMAAEYQRQLDVAGARERELVERLDSMEAAAQRTHEAEAAVAGLKADLRLRDEDTKRLEQELTNLSRVLEQFQLDRDAEQAAHDAELREVNAELADARARLQALEATSVDAARGAVKDEVEALRARAERAERVAVVAQQEKAMLRKALDDTVSQVESFKDSDLVDRRFVSQLLVTYVSRPHDSKEVLTLMSRILGFTKEQRVKIGIEKAPRNKSLYEAIFGAATEEPAAAAVRGADAAAPTKSLGEAWVDFLVSEVDDKSATDNGGGGGEGRADGGSGAGAGAAKGERAIASGTAAAHAGLPRLPAASTALADAAGVAAGSSGGGGALNVPSSVLAGLMDDGPDEPAYR